MRVLVLLGLMSTAIAASTPGQTAVVFDTLAQMCAAESLPAEGTITLKGYRVAGDGGGGAFRYDPASEAAPDGGAALQPEKLPGRLLRVVDHEEDAYAEWFGAYGDGEGPTPHDDQAAINACLRAYGRVKLLARTYGVRGKPDRYSPGVTYHAIDLGPYYRIVGSGRDQTKIKLLDGTNPHGNGPSENYFIIMSNRDFYESADYLVVRDLTVDCNFDAQNRQTTIHAIGIRGGGALVERVNFRRYGTGRHPDNGSSRECFVVHQTLVYKDPKACRRAAVLRDLDFTDAGHNGMLEGSVAEITHVRLGGADNFENKSWVTSKGADPEWDPANGGENERNWWPSYGGLVEDCVVHDVDFDPATQKSPLNGFTYGDCIGLTIRGNRVQDFEGQAVFTMSWWNRDTTIVDNQFIRVTGGLALCLQSDGKGPVQCPMHQSVLFARNEIELGAHRNAPWGTCGVTLYGGEMPPVTRMQGIHVRDNLISGRSYTGAKGQRVSPLGMKVQILRATYDDLRFEDNTIDLPEYCEGEWIPQEPYSMSMMFFPQALWEEAVKAGHVVCRGNRNKEGKVLYPILVDWYFKGPATYGKQ